MTTNPHDKYSTCIPHEYGHALDYVLANEFLGVYRPEWMEEGIANYFDEEVSGGWRQTFQTEYATYDRYFETEIVPKLRDTSDPWPRYHLRAGLPEPNRALSQMAVKHLVEVIGEDAFLSGLGEPLRGEEEPRLDYSRLSPDEVREEWVQHWFASAFGISLAQFYESFERFRRSVGSPLPVVTGHVVGQDEKPAGGVEVQLTPPGEGRYSFDITDGEGSFELTPLGGAGDYVLRVIIDDEGGYGAMHDYSWNLCALESNDERDISGLVIDLTRRQQFGLEMDVHSVARAASLPNCKAAGVLLDLQAD